MRDIILVIGFIVLIALLSIIWNKMMISKYQRDKKSFINKWNNIFATLNIRSDNIEILHVGKLENSDASIQDAMKYLKLTNSIKD